MCEQAATCTRCGDQLIHQTRRGAHESSSPFGQFIHNTYGNDFYRCDDDQATHYKIATKIWRDLEHKRIGGRQSSGQVNIMQKRALAVRELIYLQRVHPESGSFVVQSDAPFEFGLVSQVEPSNGALGAERHMEGDTWKRFLTGWSIG